MTRLRPEIRSTTDPALTGVAAYYAIYNAVRYQPGLIHGRLDGAHGEHCAIGSYFALPKHLALPLNLIDEVTAINDSVPAASPKQRKTVVLRWLRWKLETAGLRLPGRRSKQEA